MAITKVQKADQLSKIKDSFSGSEIIIFLEYSRLSVADLNELRHNLSDYNATFNVYKNRLVTLALSDYDNMHSVLQGQLGYIQAADASCSVAKVVKTYADKKDGAQIKGGVFENKVVTESLITSLAALPPKSVLISQAIQLIASPLTGLLLRMASPVSKLVYGLESINNKQEK